MSKLEKSTRVAVFPRLLFFLFTFFSFIGLGISQNANIYTFNHKSGKCSMTWEDFMDSKQTLETSISDSKIVSFVFSVSYKSGEGTVFADFECKGPEIDSKAISAMKNSRASGKFGNEVMISNVLVSISNKVIKAEDMVIQIN